MYLIVVKGLRNKSVLMSIFAVSALLAFILLFNPDIDLRAFKALMDFGHVFIFGMIAVIIFNNLSMSIPARPKRIAAFTCAFALGLLVEIIQLGMNERFFELGDLLNDAIGAFAFLAITVDYKTRTKALFTRILSILLIILSGTPFYISLIDYKLNLMRFPVINSFERMLETSSWINNDAIIERSGQLSTNGHYSARVTLLPGEYPGICREDFIHDWKGYGFFAMDIFLPGQKAFKINIRINDKTHNNDFNDRYNRAFMLKPGWNLVKISLDDVARAAADRRLNLSQITRFCVFASGLDTTSTIFIDNIRLENKNPQRH